MNTVTRNTACTQIRGTGRITFLGGTSAAFTKAKLRFIKLCNSHTLFHIFCILSSLYLGITV